MAPISRKEFAIDPPREPPDAVDVTELLADLRAGRREAFDQILPLVYSELRRTARRELGVRPSDTLSSTALVHELYLKFSRSRADWRDRAHFLGVAAVAMRHILVDRAEFNTILALAPRTRISKLYSWWATDHGTAAIHRYIADYTQILSVSRSALLARLQRRWPGTSAVSRLPGTGRPAPGARLIPR